MVRAWSDGTKEAIHIGVDGLSDRLRYCGSLYVDCFDDLFGVGNRRMIEAGNGKPVAVEFECTVYGPPLDTGGVEAQTTDGVR